MNIFKEMVLSVYSYGSYKQFLQNRKGKVFGFGVMFMVIYLAVTLMIPFFFTIFGSNGIIKSIMDNIPNFELKDGILWVEDVVEYDKDGMYIYIDTDPQYVFYGADEMEPYLSEYTVAVLMDSEKAIVKSNGETYEISYSYLQRTLELEDRFDREDLMELMSVLWPAFYIGFVIGMFLDYIFGTALYFLGALIVALLGMIVASALQYQLTFGQLYILAVYSRTLPLIIKAVVTFLPFGIPFFWVINFGLSVLILFLAIRKMKEEQPPQQFMGYNTPSGPYMN